MSGDFYVYYTNDSSGEPTQPRLAIRMDGDNRIGEVRGILPHQGVEPVMQEALYGKLLKSSEEKRTHTARKAKTCECSPLLRKSVRTRKHSPRMILFCCKKSTELSKASDIRKTRVSPNFGKEEIPKKTCSSYLDAPEMRSLTCRAR